VILILLLIVVIVAVVVVARSLGAERAGGTGRPPGRGPGSAVRSAPGDLDRWQKAGLLSAEQVAAIVRFEAEHEAPSAPESAARPRGARPRSRVPLVAEALGYLGGVLAGVGVVLVAAHYWDDLAVAGQLALAGGASLAMFAVGVIVGRLDDPAFDRMRAFVWAASSAAAGTCGVVIVRGGFDSDDVAALVLGGAVAVAAHSGALWRGRERPVQQLLALGAALTAVGSATTLVASDGWWGFAVWAAGALLVGLGLAKRGSSPDLTEAIGAIAMVVGAFTVASEWASAGTLFLVATTLGLAAVALVPMAVAPVDRWILGAIGSVASLFAVPGTVGWFAGEAGFTTGAVVWGVGALLVAAGLLRRVHLPLVAQGVGSVAMLVGAAVTAAQWPSVAPAIGLMTAIGLLVIGSRPGAVLESLAGALGLLVFVPWAVGRWFPGEGRVPILLVVSGLLILVVAIVVGRLGGRVRRELRSADGPVTAT
jgi:hypothetical protein